MMVGYNFCRHIGDFSKSNYLHILIYIDKISLLFINAKLDPRCMSEDVNTENCCKRAD